MTKKKYFIILSVFIVAFIGVLVVYLVKPKEEAPEIIHYSDEYLKTAEVFNFKLSEDESYYSITGIKKNHENDLIVNLPNSIDNIPVKKWIGDQGNFTSWRNITQIFIPENIEYIGCKTDDDGILNGGTYGDNIMIVSTSRLSSFSVSPNNKVYTSVDGILYSKDMKVLLRYPNGKVQNNEQEQANLSFFVPDSVEEIYDHAFYMNQMLAKISIGSNTTRIGQYVFDGCTNLKNVEFNTCLKQVDIAAFRKCNLETVILPDTVEEIGSRAFSYNEELSICYIPLACKTFGINIFNGVSKSFVMQTPSENIEFLKNVESLKLYKVEGIN